MINRDAAYTAIFVGMLAMGLGLTTGATGYYNILGIIMTIGAVPNLMLDTIYIGGRQ